MTVYFIVATPAEDVDLKSQFAWWDDCLGSTCTIVPNPSDCRTHRQMAHIFEWSVHRYIAKSSYVGTSMYHRNVWQTVLLWRSFGNSIEKITDFSIGSTIANGDFSRPIRRVNDEVAAELDLIML